MSPDCRSPLVTHAIASSVLEQVAYDEPRAVLHVTFRAGGIYQYLGVPQEAYVELLRAESKGVYFNRHIRNVFPCTKSHNANSAPSITLG